MARLIDPKTFRLELDKLDCIDKFGYVILPITKLNIALERSAVDAVPVRHGHLVRPNPYGECSVCGMLIDIRDGFNYCPNCGAKMDGGVNP